MDPTTPDDEFLDAVRAMSEPSDPLDHRGHGDHQGVESLRAARDLLLVREETRALTAIADARNFGVPAELVPYAAALEAAADILLGNAEAATPLLERTWGDHPDVAVLPALLGVARLASGDSVSAAHSMYAALVSDDPDRSLAIHRRLLTILLAQVREARD